jgi:Tol biopolymer transport system component
VPKRSTVLAVLAAVAASGAAAVPRAAADDRIAFTGAGSSEGADVYAVAPDGSARARLTDGRRRERMSVSPAFFPDGARLVFTSDRDFDYDAEQPDEVAEPPLPGDLYAVPFEGGDVRRLTTSPGFDDQAAVSPDGQQIAFTRIRLSLTGFSADLYAMNADGSGERQLTLGELALEPTWSPDGLSVAYTGVRLDLEGSGTGIDVRVVPSAGGASRTLVPDAYSPDYSPDGTRIAFATTRDRNGERCLDGEGDEGGFVVADHEEEGEEECEPVGEVYVARADGAEPQRLTNDRGDDGEPAFSADGTQIAFTSDRFYDRSPSYDLWTMRSDGSCQARVTSSAVQTFQPVWRPHDAGPGGPLPPLPLPVPGVGPPQGDCAAPRVRHAGPSLRPVRRWRGSRPLWAGASFRGLALSALEPERGSLGFAYRDCLARGGRCGAPIVVVNEACPNPLADRRVVRRYRSRGAVVTVHRGGSLTVLSGGLAVWVDPLGRRGASTAARRALAALRPFGARRARRLPAPALRPSVLRELRAAVDATRRHGFAGAQRRLALPRTALRDRLALARALRGAPRPAARDRREAARCDRRAYRRGAAASADAGGGPSTQIPPELRRWVRVP